MKERPIIFSGEMVCAILEGRKIQTRRVVTVPWRCGKRCLPYEPYFFAEDGRLYFQDQYGDNHDFEKCYPCPLGATGDHLWVREAFCPDYFDDWSPAYKADYDLVKYNIERIVPEPKWKPSIHMPRSFSRIKLRITDVRVERVQDITEEDAIAEGCTDGGCLNCGKSSWPNPCGCERPEPDHKDAFYYLWRKLYGKRPGLDLHSNPWVWVVKFEQIQNDLVMNHRKSRL